MIGRGQLHPDALTGLKGGTAHKNVANDLLTLTTVFRSNWHGISGRTCITLIELDETDAAVDQLLTELGVRERTHARKEETALQRKQAYTLFVRAYDQVRRAVLFDRWDEGDAGEIAPALFGGHRRKTKAEVAPDTVEPQPSVALAAPNPKANTDAPEARREAPLAPGVGMPGADPFTDES